MLFAVQIILSCYTLLAASQVVNEDHEKKWVQFVENHGKNYDCEEKKANAKRNYIANRSEIDQHNKYFEAGKVSYTKSCYHFSDMPHEEVLNMLCGTSLPPTTRALPASTLTDKQAADLFPAGPTSKDWRESCLPVQDQKVKR